MKIDEDIYLLDDLFRAGSTKSPRLDNVRKQDIEIVYREDEKTAPLYCRIQEEYQLSTR